MGAGALTGPIKTVAIFDDISLYNVLYLRTVVL
jgi:hypothetical protein